MRRIVAFSILLLVITLNGNAQNQYNKDHKAIKEMCGCFEVTFNFAETFNYSNDSLYKPSETKIEKGLEWAQLVEDKDNKIVIQHLLQVGRPDSPMVVKHWRQDWLYQNRDFYMYNGDNNWTFVNKAENEVAGQWTQKVFQVDDSPRYEGSGTWVHVDGKSYWESTTPAPLPRREYTKRSDYNITMRGNRQEITEFGWIHDQDNDKIVRAYGKDDVIIAQEKGYNVYKKVDDSRCQAAQDWWKEKEKKWALVREKWAAVFAQNKDLSLEEKVDNKVLYKHLFEDNLVEETAINKVIQSFVK